MGQPKALLQYEGETFVGRLARVLAVCCERVVVVLGYDADAVRDAVPAGAIIAVNPQPERGMLSSLQCGLRAAGEADAAMFLPVDFGAVRSETVARIAAEAGSAPIIAPVFEGAHGHPVCVARAIIEQILALPDEAQARDVIRRHRGGTLFIEVDDPGTVRDVDTPEEYRALAEKR
jgi:molybdenum cofactor cytidylyltransferase